jgi:hypothetical protein
MKNYRTTIAGAALAALSFISIYQANGGELTDWKQWLIPAAIAALGYLAKDAGVSGTAKLLIGSLCLLTLPSCQHLGPLSGIAIGYGERRQIISAADAATLREVRDIVLTTPEPKQPVRVQP